MFGVLRKMWVRHCLGGVALLSLAGLLQAQGTSPTMQPPVIPAVAFEINQSGTIQQIGAQDTAGLLPTPTPNAPKTAAGLGQPVTAPTNQPAADESKARIERLEKQIQDLTNAIKTMQDRAAQPGATGQGLAVPTSGNDAQAGTPNLSVQDVRQLVDAYMNDQAAARKKAEKDKNDQGYKVGTDMRMLATWKDGLFLETTNKDFYIHIGGEMQYDTYFWGSNNDPIVGKKDGAPKLPKGFQTGDSKGGIGEEVDSTDFRRLRFWAEGGFWEVGEFMFQPKFEKIVNGTVALDEMWVGVKDIPFFGTIRVGHHKTPQGLESDDWSSNRTFTYMERSTMSNAFFQNFGTGIVATNSVLDRRATWAAMFYKPQDGESGAQYADGDYAFTGRISGLPIYQFEGRHLLHLAVSATYRHNRNGNATVTGTPEFFDFNGGDNAFGAVTTAGSTTGAANLINNINPSVNGTLAGNSNPNGANAAALVSTGSVASSGVSVFGSELLYICGPFSIQAEYATLTFVDSIIAKSNQGDITVHGGYVALSYILTGENRTYDTRLGRLGTNYLETRTPFWFVRGENGWFNHGSGAWELEARFSHLDLNTHDIQGGETDAINLGVVWHLNNNLRVTFDYLRQNRYDMPVGVNSGWLSGFGVRTQLQF